MRAVIVGSSSVTAQRIAEALVSDGARVVGINSSDFEHPALTVNVVADMSDPSQSELAMAAAVDALGGDGIDVLVTAAAKQLGGRLHETSVQTWRAVLAGTLDTTFNAIHAAVPHLGPGSAIVALTSVNAYLAHPGNSAYATAKGAVHALVTQASLEYAPRGIRVNAVAPALIDGHTVPDGEIGYPMGRTPTSEEVAQAVAFLASARASGITGVILPVDAGLSVASPVAFTRPAMVAQWHQGQQR
ncbi:SDR family NAD(P)-dependent oxidoreductase [Occultella kanbiaonis]|uniref:SDR family NAD(P)-dependent oxidoreductase n=1 Tax=Occultella kanbiaonis TaxID=2675754 RepID=UPI00143DA5DF|nr:SDR family oxidoreductase [Occultella kanbiaonis]